MLHVTWKKCLFLFWILTKLSRGVFYRDTSARSTTTVSQIWTVYPEIWDWSTNFTRVIKSMNNKSTSSISMWFDFSIHVATFAMFSVLLQLPGVENLQCFDKHDETLPSRQEQFVAYFFINIVFNNATKSHTSRNELYNGVGAMRIT